jgi:hypothetical protein
MRLLLSLAVVFTLASSAFAQSGVAGNWTLTFQTPNGAREASAVMKVDGSKLTGAITSEVGEAPFEGTVKGNTFTVSLEVQTPNGNFKIGINGEVDGDSMKGTMDFGQGVGEFTGARKKS